MRFDKRLALVAVGAAAWLAGGVYYGGTLGEPFMLGLLLVGSGFALAAWAVPERRGAAVGGLAVAMLGMGLFLGEGLGSFANLARVGSHAFLAALLLMGVGVARGSPWAFRAGAAVGVLATLLWVAADVDGGMAWQPGNLLAGAGVAWALVRPPVAPG